MKRIVYICIALALVMSSCKKQYADPLDPASFDITICREQAYRVWLDLFPSDDFVDYAIDWMPVTMYDSLYSSDNAYLDYWIRNRSELGIYQGAYLDVLRCDYSDTKYYFLLIPLDGKNPTGLRKVEFHTNPALSTHFAIDTTNIKVDTSGMIFITPDDSLSSCTYFWDFELKNYVDERYYGFQSLWFYLNINYYYGMDFFPGVLSRGFKSDNIFNYYSSYEITDTTTIFLSVVGYADKVGETSDRYFNFLIKHEKGTFSVEKAPADNLDYVFLPVSKWPTRKTSTLPKYGTPMEQESSPGWRSLVFPRRIGRYNSQHIRSRK